MRLRERHLMLLGAIICLPLLLVLLPIMLLARFGRARRNIKIGLTVSDRWPAYLQYVRLPYDLAIWRAGAKVVTITTKDIDRLDLMLDKVDAVIISGGEDVAAPDNAAQAIDLTEHNLQRDELEFEVLRRVEERDLPLLCICRGMQLFAIAHGGTLTSHRHLVESRYRHRSTLTRLAMHKLLLVKGSRLEAILHHQEIVVNSIHYHHVSQAGDLLVSAYSDDGMIEAVELEGRDFAIGVQWHPELLAIFNWHNEKLFTALVEAACRKKLLPQTGD